MRLKPKHKAKLESALDHEIKYGKKGHAICREGIIKQSGIEVTNGFKVTNKNLYEACLNYLNGLLQQKVHSSILTISNHRTFSTSEWNPSYWEIR